MKSIFSSKVSAKSSFEFFFFNTVIREYNNIMVFK